MLVIWIPESNYNYIREQERNENEIHKFICRILFKWSRYFSRCTRKVIRNCWSSVVKSIITALPETVVCYLLPVTRKPRAIDDGTYSQFDTLRRNEPHYLGKMRSTPSNERNRI